MKEYIKPEIEIEEFEINTYMVDASQEEELPDDIVLPVDPDNQWEEYGNAD